MAAGLSPPTQMGGCGFCTGLGRKLMPEKLTYSPANAGSSSVHSVLHARRYSSVTRPRRSKGGAPTASNSSFIQPAPTPKMTRPAERTSRVARIFAVSTAPRCGTTATELMSLDRGAIPARKASSVN